MDDDERTLFIGNIDRNVTEEILYELFLQAGPIERVCIPSNKNDSSRFGFVTYKHECSINYAINIFKGTSLFKKQLSIKKRNPKNNNDFDRGNIYDSKSNHPENFNFQEQSHNLQNLAQSLNYNSQSKMNFSSNSLRGNWTSRNRPYNMGRNNNFPRPRDRAKDRNYGYKMYHGRKNRRRD